MEDLKNFLLSDNKDYKTGLSLFKKYCNKPEEYEFFRNIEIPISMHMNMLTKRLSNFYRITVKNEKDKKPEIPIVIENRPIIINKTHYSKKEGEPELEHTKILTIKLLARDWDELDYKEKKYFNSDKRSFDLKKNLMIANSRLESEIKSIHAEMQISDSESTRASLADKLVLKKQLQTRNWKTIDDFSINEPEKSAHIDKSELIKLRNNLRCRISKLKKQIEDKGNKKFEKWSLELINAESELDGINRQID
jgi:hypothetical protein